MISIYQDFFNVLSKSGCQEYNRMPNERDLSTIKALAKLALTNAKKTAECLLKGHLSKLDPIVGENTCQGRALAVISATLNFQLMEEAKQMHKQSAALLQKLQKKPLHPTRSVMSLLDLFKTLDLDLFISPELHYLLNAHLCTIGKLFQTRRDGSELSCLDASVVVSRLSKHASLDLVAEVLILARQHLAKETVVLLQQEAYELGKPNHMTVRAIKQIRTISTPIKLQASCAFFNLAIVLSRIYDGRIPILIRELEQRGITPLHLIFQRGENIRGMMPIDAVSLDASQALLTFDVYFDPNRNQEEITATIETYGLLNVILANASIVKQFSEDEDISILEPEARKEIQAFRTMAHELGCGTPRPLAFTVAHVHANTTSEVFPKRRRYHVST